MVEVSRVEVVRVALKLDGGVSVDDCGSIEARRATSGMMGGCLPSVDLGYFVTALRRKTSFSLL